MDNSHKIVGEFALKPYEQDNFIDNEHNQLFVDITESVTTESRHSEGSDAKTEPELGIDIPFLILLNFQRKQSNR
eukprot:UN08448